MPSPRRVTVLLPPSISIYRRLYGCQPIYPSLPKMQECSPRICAVLDEREIELIAQSWEGTLSGLCQNGRCLVHYSGSLGELGAFINACDNLGHLLFNHDRIHNGKERDPSRAVEQWLDKVFALA